MVTEAMCGPRYRRKVCRPVPKPTLLKIPRPTLHQHHGKYVSYAKIYYKEDENEGRII